MDPNQFNIVHKKSTAIPGPSRRLCSSMYRTPLTETLESTSFHIYGTISSRHLQLFSASQPTNHPTPQPHNTPYWFPLPPPTTTITAGGTLIFLFLFLMVSTHVYPKHSPLLTYNKSYSSAILVSFLHFIC